MPDTKYNDHNTVHFTGRYRTYVPVTAISETPWVSPDFSDTRASVLLTAQVGSDHVARKLDADKVDLLLGTTKPNTYRPHSIIGKLVNRLSARFHSNIEVNDVTGIRWEDGQLGIRLSLHPIPDGTDAARFAAAVRQTMRGIAEEMQPHRRAR